MTKLVGENLVKRYGPRTVVKGISLEVGQGEIVGLLGPNGAGKTTTFYMLVGLVSPNGGRVLHDGREITHQPMYRRARGGVGYLPQEPSIFRRLTVEDNLRCILQLLGLSAAEQKQRSDSLLEDFGLTHLRRTMGYQVSGGERRRVEIARALVTRPSFLLLDEPFTGVDPIAVDSIQQIITRLRDQGIGVLLTDHSVRETLAVTDRSYIIFDGEILTSGQSQDLPNDPVAREFYLGERFQM